ncbi:uncharacterized protein FIBRA_06759 [Fibroporia radiculosa]|uniref:RNA-dependent RNA polymerase n=1 Tax=Fibroporia radiculosa TaxID=599839 RepID=J4GCF1_9APHY|nr:uncharacterized protein FIBRA_06759 [Fibroporia radiculosa]CCM04578.1 predicted protein [Fibroporia radiculosa]
MDIHLSRIPYTATVYDVRRAIANVLHSDEFQQPDPHARAINFKVVLDMDESRGVQNKGTGTLTLPKLKTYDLHSRLFQWLSAHKYSIPIEKGAIYLRRSERVASRKIVSYLSKARYIDPALEELRDSKVDALREHIRVDITQLGMLFYPFAPGPPRPSFSAEWTYPIRGVSESWVAIDYKKKNVRIELEDPSSRQLDAYIVIDFADVDHVWIEYDVGHPFACFSLIGRPKFEKPANYAFFDDSEGHFGAYDEDVDQYLEIDEIDPQGNTTDYKSNYTDRGYLRRRVTMLDEIHRRVAPFTTHVRICFPTQGEWERFDEQCKVAGFPIRRQSLEAINFGMYSVDRLRKARAWMQVFDRDWPFAFQLTALLYNGSLNTEELSALRPDIEKLHREQASIAASVLQDFKGAPVSPNIRTIVDHRRYLARIIGERTMSLGQQRSDKNIFTCHHVTFTPTRMILEGPSRLQSNSVVREYWENRDRFIRVDFVDENRSHFRLDQEVDGASFLQDRVGTILKGGFQIASRVFELLGYSNSSLGDHVFWFVNPFERVSRNANGQEVREFITAEEIRRRLGDLSEIALPAKYAARIGQAFTSTYFSVQVVEDEWEEIEEILEDRDNPKSHVDGLGRISQDLANAIWEGMCEEEPERRAYGVKPSAFQIRFIGYKGVVAVDRQLKGRKLCLRPEMRKFKPHRCDGCRAKLFCAHLNNPIQSLHIAEAFHGPRRAYLTRDPVTILEDREVRDEVFENLQDEAKRTTYMARDSSEKYLELLQSHHLGFQYRLPFLLQRLLDIGLDCGSQILAENVLNDPFFLGLREYGIQHVLRDLKTRARIPVPNSYLLVGVADEGPAYTKQGHSVYQLKNGQIFACVQESPDAKPIWLKGLCFITRSPTVHPGDVQRVTAIGKPDVPDGQICLFEHMKNVVVLPTVGCRSLASCLGGGDLDGDLYYVFHYSQLLPVLHVPPAAYPDEKPPPRQFTFDDVCDFIVEYMHSDVLGLLSVRRLVIADQSQEGSLDKRCIELARLCSDAVDYPKTGRAVNSRTAPKKLLPYSPDWHADEDNISDPLADCYQSDRALGKLYRRIKLNPLPPSTRSPVLVPSIAIASTPLSDNISMKLLPLLESRLGPFGQPSCEDVLPLFRTYLSELRCIALMHSLSPKPGTFVSEEEVVLGVILATNAERRIKGDRTYRMREDVGQLAWQTRQELLPGNRDTVFSQVVLSGALRRAWLAWRISRENRDIFGAGSFGLIVLGVIFDVFDRWVKK